MSDYFAILLLTIFGVATAMYMYYWWHMFSYIKGDTPPLAFFNIGYLFSPDKFNSIGNKYRKKALLFMLIAIGSMILMFSLGRYVQTT